jgi:hypothetical protein
MHLAMGYGARASLKFPYSKGSSLWQSILCGLGIARTSKVRFRLPIWCRRRGGRGQPSASVDENELLERAG